MAHAAATDREQPTPTATDIAIISLQIYMHVDYIHLQIS
jgi:hypothetical protein